MRLLNIPIQVKTCSWGQQSLISEFLLLRNWNSRLHLHIQHISFGELYWRNRSPLFSESCNLYSTLCLRIPQVLFKSISLKVLYAHIVLNGEGICFMCIKCLTLCLLACMCVLICFSYVWHFATLWTVAHQDPLYMGFSRQEYWSGLPVQCSVKTCNGHPRVPWLFEAW